MEEKKRLKVALIGKDENIFNIMAITAKALNKEERYKEKNNYLNKMFGCKSYDEAIRVTTEYVDIV